MKCATKKEKEEILSLIKEIQAEGRRVLAAVGHDIKIVEGNETNANRKD